MRRANVAGSLAVLVTAGWLPAGAQMKRFEANWESLKQYQVPEWFQDAKFGIFLHWGVYAVPAFGNEWYPRRMYMEYRTGAEGPPASTKDPVFEHHIKTWGPQSKFGYKDFVPLFKAEKWDPNQWADLFQKAGARYVVPVAEHHDGFAMYASSHTRWNSLAMGPKRDIVGELGKSVRQRGMHFGVSSHYAFNRAFYTCKDGWDTCDPSLKDLYGIQKPLTETAPQQFLDHWYARTLEIVENYKPEVLWFDFGMNYPEFQPSLQKLAAHYYNRSAEWKQGPVLQYKTIHKGSFPDGTAVLDIERGKLDNIRKMAWQTDTSISTKSWGYIENDDFKSTDSLVDDLVDIVSKNGCLLLNVGPKADGTIPAQAEQILLEIGQWLKMNGEAIYGTRYWQVFGEGPTQEAQGHMGERQGRKPFTAQDIRFTTKGNTLYAIALDWPKSEMVIHALAAGSKLASKPVRSVQLLGLKEKLQWKQTAEGLVVHMPAAKHGAYAHAFRIEFR